jgi:hypothetical protein
MIALDLTQETTTPAASAFLGLKPEKSEKGSLSFSALLQGIKEDDKAVQNGALVLSLADTTKESAPLKGAKNEKDAKDVELLEINPEVKAALSPHDFKLLIKDAKAYLKNKIISSDGFKRSEIDKLPKTLKGLVQVAKKIGIDIAKISLEEIRPQVKTTLQTAEIDIKKEPDSKKVAVAKKNESASLDLRETALSATTKQSKKSSKAHSNAAADESIVQEQIKTDQKQTPKESKETPLFKVQKHVEISTEQMVSAKALHSNGSDAVAPKKRADDTLKLLLQGKETAKKEGSRLTSDFSVATAKVIAPHAKSEAAKTLESLLKSDNKDEKSSDVKTDTIHVAKADSFEVKLSVAKQMVKYLSQDVKQAIDNYKAPFTRVKVALNPQKLGSVELTVVQRGKNLHVNLSSNNAAINTLALNANDLKVQLQNSGIQNASLNFSNNGQGSEFANGGQMQQHQQQRQDAHDEYNYFDNEEKSEELVSSLEIVVPNYA